MAKGDDWLTRLAGLGLMAAGWLVSSLNARLADKRMTRKIERQIEEHEKQKEKEVEKNQEEES